MTVTHGGDIYTPRYETGRDVLDFSANISPLGTPAGVIAAIRDEASRLDRYPDPYCRELRGALSRRHRIAPEHIVCGNGASDLIYRLVQWRKPREALLPSPGFSEYGKALEESGCTVRRYPLKEPDFQLDEPFLSHIRKGTDMLFLCNPNNPTGLTVPPGLLREIILRCAACGALLVADECFNEFLDDPALHTVEGALREFPGLCILKAFTKLYGLAGLRLGYLLCGDTAHAEGAARTGQAWPVSAAAQSAGVAALEERGYAEAVRRLIRAERETMKAGLQGAGLEVLSGEANYLFVKIPASSGFDRQNFFKNLRDAGFLARNCADYPGLDNTYCRLAVRKPEENRMLLEALRRMRNVQAGSR
ncbi:MAG: aminotransferase class I/II-fold pyridoxal phosphate-dependent enzyme [Spirochaetaceae bacterium]|jgi:threonine-phosphate decarboxylase|nr:aminotransferase class I/II-fold pyridoxal phosphate-dependent enzyme [Spirochaetaceae bacterium]